MLRTYPLLKVWVAGCSSGEEVCSLAILLQEEGLLDRSLQERALGLFRKALCRRGSLGLGSKESLRLSAQAVAFDDFVRAQCIYQKKGE